MNTSWNELYAAMLKALLEKCGCPLDESHAEIAVNAIIPIIKEL